MPFLAPIGFAMGVGTAATATAAASGVLAASLVGGLTLATAGLGIASIAKGSKQTATPQAKSIIQAPAAPSFTESTPTQESALAVAEREAKAQRKRRTKTVLTDLGDTNLLSPSVTGKSLLGA